MTNQDRFSSAEAAAAAGISYRQLDYWTRVGIVTPVVAARGSGSQRKFSLDNIVTLAVIDAFSSNDHADLPFGIEELVEDGAPMIVCETSTAGAGIRRRAKGTDPELVLSLLKDGTHAKALLIVDVDAIRDVVEARLSEAIAA